MKSFNEMLLKHLSQEEFEEIDEPKISNYFYQETNSWFSYRVSSERKNEILEYLFFLEYELLLNKECKIEFLNILKNNYKNYLTDVTIDRQTDKKNWKGAYRRKQDYEIQKSAGYDVGSSIFNSAYDDARYHSAKIFKGNKYFSKEMLEYEEKYYNEYLDKIKIGLENIIVFIDNEIDKINNKELFTPITCKFESNQAIQFPSKFIKNSPFANKLIWKGNQIDLIFLIEELVRLGFISSNKNIDNLISRYFVWKDAEIVPDEISDLKSKLHNNSASFIPSLEIKKSKL